MARVASVDRARVALVERPRVAFVDLDRTLLDVNSGRLWVQHQWRQGDLGLGQVLSAFGWLLRYSLGDDGLEQAVRDAAQAYAGVAWDDMEAEVAAWFAREVRGHVRPGALEALARHRDLGDTLVLATSSSCFAAACAQEAFGFDDVIATDVAVQDGILTGGIAALGFGHHKADRCLAWLARHGIPPERATFYTDSYSDVALLDAVGEPVVVSPDRRLFALARRRAWPVVDWGEASA